MGKKRTREDNENEFDPAPKHLQAAHIRNQEKRLIVILENAQLESVKVSKNHHVTSKNSHEYLIIIECLCILGW